MLSTYGFDGLHQFLLSLIPSAKYDFVGTSLTASMVIGVFSHFLGLTPVLVVTMAIVIFAEMLTGIYASNKCGEAFESFKFSRGVLKICVWCVIFFTFNSFANEMALFEGWPYLVAAIVFQVLHASAMVWFAIENGTSILENYAVIDGKPKTAYIEAVKSIWKSFITTLTGRIK